MSETITVRGFLGSPVEDFTTPNGLPIASFRLGCTPRRYDRKTDRWVNADTNWYSVSTFRQLAQNVKSSLSKGDPVLVTGRLRVRQWENDRGQRGTSVEIDAEAVGYDLTFGSGSFTRLGPGTTQDGGARFPAGEGAASQPESAGNGARSAASAGSAAAADPWSPPEQKQDEHAAAAANPGAAAPGTEEKPPF